jgi:RimJ/RimL family protein N-acetyltransferase
VEPGANGRTRRPPGRPRGDGYIGAGPVTPERTAELVEAWTKGWQRDGFSIWAACNRATGSCIGRIGVAMQSIWDEPEVGWLLSKPSWGRGLATEGGSASLRFAFESADLDRIISVCRPANHRSENVMRKLGMHHDRDATHPTLGFPVRIYAIDRARWEELFGVRRTP